MVRLGLQVFGLRMYTAGNLAPNKAGFAYGKTVWSWPSLLRSSVAEAQAGSTGRACAVNSRRDGDNQEFVPGESAA
jgi:hypothetical protein